MKTNDLLKVSRFNYSCEDKHGNWLICNFAKGPNSFGKILKDDIDKYKRIMDSDNITFDENKNCIVKLCDKGFLISKNTDEELTVKSLYYNAVMDSKLSLIILPTEQCNFRCTYCYESFEKGKMTKENQNSLLKFIQKKLAYSTNLNISWFGGEPLEALDVIEYIMGNVNILCKTKKIVYLSDMTTNAYNLDAKTFDKLYKLKVYRYQITLDGLKEQHDKQRIKADGSGTFDKIVENLLYIKNNPQYKLVQITIRMNMTADILANWKEFWHFYKSNLGGDNRFNIMFGPAGDLGGERVNAIKDAFVNSSDIYEKLLSCETFEDEELNITEMIKAFTPMAYLCYAAKKNSLVVGSDLNIYKCTVRYTMTENIIGHIMENGDSIIKEEFYNKWYIDNSEHTLCKSCFYFPCCYGGGCAQKRNFTDVSIDKCRCNEWKRELNTYMIYISNKFNFEKINFEGI